VFFVSTVRAPPMSTLFPYTTLFRSVAVIWILVMVVSHLGLRRGHRYRPWQNKMAGLLVVSLALIIGIPLGVGSVEATSIVSGRRSEEHTSELQSRFDLVCRLLLEKK